MTDRRECGEGPAVAVETRRAVIEAAGPDAETFLQGLWSNDVAKAGDSAPIYAALLTPQGKFLADAFIQRTAPETFALDVDAASAPNLLKRLAMYKLRADVSVRAREDLAVVVSWETSDPRDTEPAGPRAVGALDPRDPRLGWRALLPTADAATMATRDLADYDARLIAFGAPRAGADLAADDAFILEYDFERLNGVDFKKGCYVGQEVTARMRHKTELRRGLFRVRGSDAATPPAPGTAITASGKPAGRLGAVAAEAAGGGWTGLALLRKDRLEDALAAGEAALDVIGPAG